MESTFLIIREDRAVDPKTVVTEGLKLGRSPERGHQSDRRVLLPHQSQRLERNDTKWPANSFQRS
jgi:hypothetical protein